MGLKNLLNRKRKKKTDENNTTDKPELTSPTNSSPEASRTKSSDSRVRIEEELEHVFKKFDVNGDGKICASELGSIMGSLGHHPTTEELQNMIKEVDADGDGFINLEEFIELNTKGIDSTEVLENLKDAFSIFDIDKNGLITAEELLDVLKSLGENCTINDSRKMIAGADRDGDGMINFEEFKDMMKMGNHFDSKGLQKQEIISHQWTEWIMLMEKLMKYGYFDGDKNPIRSGRLIDGKSCNQIRTACLNFARDRPDLMSCFVVGDVDTIAGSGCPSIDRKVVNSGKRLRAHLGIDEGNVCSSCNLRGNCDRAYVKAHEGERGHTVDVMRFVVTYGLDHKKPFINKRLEEAIRSLTKDMVKFSKNKLDTDHSKRDPPVQRSPTQQQEHQSTSPTIHDGWNCSKNVKSVHCNDKFHERHPRSRNNQDHVQLKGDWLCIRCNYFNFAKNTRCLQCHTNPPKRQLSPGEWECDSCNYINFRRNMACLKCDHKRPKAFNDLTR